MDSVVWRWCTATFVEAAMLNQRIKATPNNGAKSPFMPFFPRRPGSTVKLGAGGLNGPTVHRVLPFFSSWSSAGQMLGMSLQPPCRKRIRRCESSWVSVLCQRRRHNRVTPETQQKHRGCWRTRRRTGDTSLCGALRDRGLTTCKHNLPSIRFHLTEGHYCQWLYSDIPDDSDSINAGQRCSPVALEPLLWSVQQDVLYVTPHATSFFHCLSL